MAGYVLSGLLPLTSGEPTGQIVVPPSADDLGRELKKIVADHATEMDKIDANLAQLKDEFVEANQRQAMINEKQAKRNEVVDARLSNLELLNPEFSPAPKEKPVLKTRKYLKQ